MVNPSKLFAGATRADAPLDQQSQPREDWRLPRVNLLVIGMDTAVQNILRQLVPVLEEPIATWRPGERFVLPPVARAGTMILLAVDALALEDQQRLLEWSEQASGRTRVISTAAAPLFPLVEAGAFIDSLYYRLNTVCVDVTRSAN
jgi:hypothetical protein